MEVVEVEVEVEEDEDEEDEDGIGVELEDLELLLIKGLNLTVEGEVVNDLINNNCCCCFLIIDRNWIEVVEIWFNCIDLKIDCNLMELLLLFLNKIIVFHLRML